MMNIESLKSVKSIYEDSEMVLFWGHSPAINNVITDSCLSQWYKCKFTETYTSKDGATKKVNFTSTEQYMMFRKASIFKDYEIANHILKIQNPKTIKGLGRKIKDFDEAIWDKHKVRVVIRGNYLKFSQNEELKKHLLSTGDKIIVEASPYDKVWGVGMSRGNKGIYDLNKWKGENLLGFSLMAVRAYINSKIEDK